MVNKEKQDNKRREDATLQLLDMRLYDVLNMLGNLMMDNETTEEEIVIKCVNGFTGNDNILSVKLEEVTEE